MNTLPGAIVAIDLAAKASAVTTIDFEGKVRDQWTSYGMDPDQFVLQVLDTVEAAHYEDDVHSIVIEDLPHGLPFAGLIKTVCRLQGRIIQAIMDNGATRGLGIENRIVFVPPALWQRHFGIFKGGKDAAAAKALADYAYVPPDLLETQVSLIPEKGPERQKVRAALKKSMTDLVDSYLIAQWAKETWEAFGSLYVPSAQPWDKSQWTEISKAQTAAHAKSLLGAEAS